MYDYCGLVKWRLALMSAVAASLAFWLSLKRQPDWYWTTYTAVLAALSGAALTMMWMYERRVADTAMTRARWWRFGLTVQVLYIVGCALHAGACAVIWYGLSEGAISHGGPRGGSLPTIFMVAAIGSCIYMLLFIGRLIKNWGALDQMGGYGRPETTN